MNNFAALLAAGMLLSGCVYNSKVSTSAEQLQHHRFVLTSVNGQPLKEGAKPLELSFGEKTFVSGNMCNRFSGEGKIYVCSRNRDAFVEWLTKETKGTRSNR